MGKPSSWFKSLRKAIQNHVNDDADYVRSQHLPHRRPSTCARDGDGPSNQAPRTSPIGESARITRSDSSAATKELFPLAETRKPFQSPAHPRKKLPPPSAFFSVDVVKGPFLQISDHRSSTHKSPSDPVKRKAPAIAVADVGAIVRNTGGAAGVRRMLEEWAAITIQTAFRGILARRAVASLKSLVRLQALVRGHLIRKRMQTLVRIQARTLNRRTRPPGKSNADSNHKKPTSYPGRFDYGSEDWNYTAHNMQLATVQANSKENSKLKRQLEESSKKERALTCAEELAAAAQTRDRQEATSRRERALACALLLTLTAERTELDPDDYTEIENAVGKVYGRRSTIKTFSQ